MVNGDGSFVRCCFDNLFALGTRIDHSIDMNLPICGVAALLVLTVDLRVPRRTFKEKMASLDWM